MGNTNNGFSEFPIHKFMATLSDILSEKYGCKITITAIPKDQVQQEPEKETEAPTQKAG